MIHRWIADNRNPRSLASMARRRRNRELAKFLEHIESVRSNTADLIAPTAVQESIRVLDVGGTPDFWDKFLPTLPPGIKVDVTLCNLGGRFGPGHGYRRVNADARYLVDTFRPNDFELVVSNSLIEHVGHLGAMVSVAANIKTVGRWYYVQTPNYWFPIEPHWVLPFFHWLPEEWRVRLVQSRGWGHMPRHPEEWRALESVRSVRLLDRGDMEYLFPRADLIPERVGPFVKSWIATGRTQ